MRRRGMRLLPYTIISCRPMLTLCSQPPPAFEQNQEDCTFIVLKNLA